MIHKEGYRIILIALLLLVAFNAGVYLLSQIKVLNYALIFGSIAFFLLIMWFFRNPERVVEKNDNAIYSPADGEIVLIKKVYEKEYYKSERIQVSIFMSPLNVHVNRYPVSGEIKYVKYYPGKYLVAWHPKSSEKNEHTVIVIEKDHERGLLLKQIAGAVARRIVTYSKAGEKAVQGEDLGFIKFGSRVDLLLPVDCKIHVDIGEKVNGNLTTIATFK